jgi:hypothetical protein
VVADKSIDGSVFEKRSFRRLFAYCACGSNYTLEKSERVLGAGSSLLDGVS